MNAVRISPIAVWRRGYLFLRPPPNGPKAANGDRPKVNGEDGRSRK